MAPILPMQQRPTILSLEKVDTRHKSKLDDQAGNNSRPSELPLSLIGSPPLSLSQLFLIQYHLDSKTIMESKRVQTAFHKIIGRLRTDPGKSLPEQEFLDNLTICDLSGSGEAFVTKLADILKKRSNNKILEAVIETQIGCLLKNRMRALGEGINQASAIFHIYSDDEPSCDDNDPEESMSQEDEQEQETSEDSTLVRQENSPKSVKIRQPKAQKEYPIRSEEPTSKLKDFAQKYPSLPPTFAPIHLLCNLIQPKYLESLYVTQPDLFPADWESEKRKDPEAAWTKLNENIKAHLNERFADQGLKLDRSTIEMNPYPLMNIKLIIEGAVARSIARAIHTGGSIQAHQNELAVLKSQMKDLLIEFRSAVTKISNWDVLSCPTAPINIPSLQGPSLMVPTPGTSSSQQGPQMTSRRRKFDINKIPLA